MQQMDFAGEMRTKMGEDWLPAIYAVKVRGVRTRSVSLEIAEKENTAEIQHTLLGIELKVGKRRIACPDLATARYLRVFARLGARDVAIPYDITRISGVADELETAWQKTLLLCSDASEGEPQTARNRRRGRVIKSMREEIAAIGAGDTMPEFRQSTTQRSH